MCRLTWSSSSLAVLTRGPRIQRLQPNHVIFVSKSSRRINYTQETAEPLGVSPPEAVDLLLLIKLSLHGSWDYSAWIGSSWLPVRAHKPEAQAKGVRKYMLFNAIRLRFMLVTRKYMSFNAIRLRFRLVASDLPGIVCILDGDRSVHVRIRLHLSSRRRPPWSRRQEAPTSADRRVRRRSRCGARAGSRPRR